MADPYDGLSADEWRKALAEVRAQIPGMRAEAEALNKELDSGRKTVGDIEASARRNARIGAAATPAASTRASPEAVAASTERQARASKQVAAAETEAAAARTRSADAIRRFGLTSRVGQYPTFGAPPAQARAVQSYADLRRAQIGAGTQLDPALVQQRQLALPRGAIQLPARTPIPPTDLKVATAETEKLAASTAKATRAGASFGDGWQRNSAVMGAASQDMRRFGALTTEFISAAGRGAVTVKELGYQVTSTIGKFGGWLVAGAAVYTAFGALQAVGKGAIDAQSGVSQLERVVNNVDTDSATQSFRDLADHYNLPIEDVTNAAFEMGKVFKDQNQSLEATQAILASVKVGELDVATSSRYLTAIVQAFKLPASDMINVFDQINQAQNQFGIRIEDSLAGLAKASGTFKTAGGDISSLLALITTARRATGQTGEVIGTALSRAPNFLRQQANQQILRDYGLDAAAPIDQLIEDAINKAKGLKGPKIQELAAAIFGPQYGARIGTPLLQQADLYAKVLRDTSPEASKNSAEIELQSVLAQTSEQLQKVINQLQILGAGLAQAGAFDALGGLLKALNGVLSLANDIVSVFNTLPEIFRKAVTYAAQLATVVAVSRRLNVGESFGGREGGFLGRTLTRKDQYGFRYKEGLVAQQTYLGTEAATSSTAATRASLGIRQAEIALVEEQQALQKVQLAAQSGQLGLEEDITSQEKRIVAAQNQLTAAHDAELAAKTRTKVILAESLNVQTQLTALQNGANAKLLAAQHGVIVPGRIGASTEAAAGLAGFGGRGPEFIDRGSFGQPFNPNGISNLRRNIGQVGVFAGSWRTASDALKQQVIRADIALRTASLSGIGASLTKGLTSFASYLGYFDAFLVGAFILFDGYQKIKATIDKVNQAKAAPTTDLSSFEEAQNALRDAGNEKSTIAGLAFGQYGAIGEASDERDRRDAERTAEKLALIRGQTPASSQYLYQEDYEQYTELIRSAYRSGTETLKQQSQRVNNLITSVRNNGNIEDEAKAELITGFRLAQLESDKLRATYGTIAGLAGEDLGKEITDYGKAVGTGYATQHQRRTLFRDTLVQGAELFGSNKPEDITALDQAFDDSASAITDAAQKELDYNLAFAKGQAERNAAYNKYFEATKPSQVADESDRLIREQRAKLSENRAIIDKLQKDKNFKLIQALEAVATPTKLDDAGLAIQDAVDALSGKDTNAIERELKARGKSNRQIRDRIKEIRKAQEEASKRIKEIRKEIQVQRFEENQALIEARSSLREGAANEGLPALRIALNTVGRLVENAIKQYGRGSKEVLDLLQQQRDAREAIVEEQLNLIQARGDYQQAGLGAPGQETAKAQAEISNLQQQLAFMQAHRNQYSAADILGIQAQIREAQVQLVQDAKQEAEDLKNAIFDIRAARANAAGNDVAAARAELAKALYALRIADTKTERKTARADVINQKAAVRDAIFTTQIEDIQFQADIGKLTLQQQIRQYQQMLKTAEINRDQRRELRRKIEELKNQAEQEAGSFDLDLGNIKLPTVYEIRRAIQGGVGGGNQVNVSQQNTYNVNGSNANDIVNQLAAKQADAARRNRNQARSAGIL